MGSTQGHKSPVTVRTPLFVESKLMASFSLSSKEMTFMIEHRKPLTLLPPPSNPPHTHTHKTIWKVCYDRDHERCREKRRPLLISILRILSIIDASTQGKRLGKVHFNRKQQVILFPCFPCSMLALFVNFPIGIPRGVRVKMVWKLSVTAT